MSLDENDSYNKQTYIYTEHIKRELWVIRQRMSSGRREESSYRNIFIYPCKRVSLCALLRKFREAALKKFREVAHGWGRFHDPDKGVDDLTHYILSTPPPPPGPIYMHFITLVHVTSCLSYCNYQRAVIASTQLIYDILRAVNIFSRRSSSFLLLLLLLPSSGSLEEGEIRCATEVNSVNVWR